MAVPSMYQLTVSTNGKPAIHNIQEETLVQKNQFCIFPCLLNDVLLFSQYGDMNHSRCLHNGHDLGD
jgi:hypothetical protein